MSDTQPWNVTPIAPSRRWRLSLLIAGLALVSCATPPPSPSQPAPMPTATAVAPTIAPTIAPTVAPTATLAASPTAAALPDEAAIALSDKLIKNLIGGDYAGAAADFDDQMRSALPDDKLKTTWEAVLGQVGAFQAQLSSQVQKQDPYLVVITPLRFEKMTLDAKVVVDPATGKVSGLFFAPNQASLPTALPYQPPAYVQADRLEEREVTVGSGEWAVPGVLTLPKGASAQAPVPAVVLVAGSGPNDRDETVGPNKPFRDLAWGLASNGVASLRYDKRTRVHGQEMMALPGGFTVQEEVVDDALAAAEILRNTPGVDPSKVYVLGHSLGGMLAPRIAAADPKLAGLVILAGATRPLEDLMVEQTQYILGLDGSVSPEEQAQLDALKEQAGRVKALKPGEALTTTEPVLGAPPRYWQDLNGYRPVEAARSVPHPMLILQGERDYQVTMAQFEDWREGLGSREDVQFKSYPDLNHLFIAGQGQISPAEYETPGHVAEQVVKDIAAWLTAR